MHAAVVVVANLGQRDPVKDEFEDGEADTNKLGVPEEITRLVWVFHAFSPLGLG